MQLSLVLPDLTAARLHGSTVRTSALAHLLEYPYGCTEQLTSKLVPLVAMKELAAMVCWREVEDELVDLDKGYDKMSRVDKVMMTSGEFFLKSILYV